MSADCIFCRIVKGEIPATVVHEDDQVLAFMDIGPIIKGHTLVIPKEHYDPITTVPADLLSRLMAVVQKVAAAQVNGLKADGVNILQANGRAAGQLVPHVHFHVIPRFSADGHHWNWAAGKYARLEEMEQVADQIRRSLS